MEVVSLMIFVTLKFKEKVKDRLGISTMVEPDYSKSVQHFRGGFVV